MVKVLVIYYSLYGHLHTMASAIAEGARQVEGVEVVQRRVPETLSAEVLAKMGATEAQKNLNAQVPILTDPNELSQYDAIILGSPTRYGNTCGQVSQFLDSTGGLWMSGALVGKVGAVFTSSASQHGGQETTIRSLHTVLLHQGLIIVGLPYSFQGQLGLDEIKGGSPYGSSTITGGKGERMPSQVELDAARFQGKHVATITKNLVTGAAANSKA